MSPTIIASLVTAFVTIVGTLIATFLWKPGQKETTEAAIGQVQIDIATGALKLVTTGLTEEVERLTKKVHALNQEVDRLKSELEQCRLVHHTTSPAQETP